MKNIATAILLFASSALSAQKIKDISYYNSLAWKDEASYAVYIDNTYKIPSETKTKILYKTINYTVIPYTNYYPYRYNNGYANNFYYTNGFTPVYYTPIHFSWRNHHRR